MPENVAKSSVVPAFPGRVLGKNVRSRRFIGRSDGRNHCHRHVDPAIAGLCLARRIARRGGDLCFDPAARGLRPVRNVPGAGGGAGRRRVAHDGLGPGTAGPGINTGLRRGGRGIGAVVGTDAAGDGIPAHGRGGEFPVSPGDRGVHNRLGAADRGQSGQAHPWHRGAGTQPARRSQQPCGANWHPSLPQH